MEEEKKVLDFNKIRLRKLIKDLEESIKQLKELAKRFKENENK